MSGVVSADTMDAQWRAVFLQSPVPIATSDLNGRFIVANEAYCRLTGYSVDELRSMTFLDITYPDDRGENLRILDELVLNEKPVASFRKRYVRRDGEIVWAQVSASVVRSETGSPICFSVVVHEITDLIAMEDRRRRADDSVRRSEKRLRQILEASTTGVVLNDADGRFLYANPPMLRLLGYSQENLEEGQLSWDMIQVPELRESDDRALDQLRASGSCEPYETELVRRDGSRVPVYVGAALVPDDSGAGQLGTAFVMDLTPLRDAQDELIALNRDLDDRVRQRTADLERANEEMAAFTYHVSHDLRAPLRAIVATARLLQEDHRSGLGPEADRLLERQTAAANKLGTLIDELLRLSRLTRQECRSEPVDLSVLATDVVEEHRYENELVQVEVEPGLVAQGDPRLLRLLLSNLVSNALRYSPDGGTVRIGNMETPGGAAFFVKDEGIGFDMRYADKLFKPFERLVTEADFPGTGVGLANAARVIDKHGGHIWAESSPGEGATFYFTLP